ncbi:carbohydrate ABC transporter permease [Lacrimispora sp.]|uniref:carbohydrate ABC transporter permease n=1 Tax=Lacrimispora sp. TaxID=2719234 RepID=UPI002FDA72AD
MRTRKRTPYLYMLPGVSLVLFFVYVPVLMNVVYSLFRLSSYSAGQTFVGLNNYKRFFADQVFPIMLKNNIAYCLISLLVQVGFGTILALILESNAIGGRAKNFFRNVYYIPALISLTAVGLMFTFIYEPNIGFINNLLKAVNLPARGWLGDSKLAIYCIIAMSQWQFTGYITLLMVVAFQNVPQEYIEAASIDGAGPFKRAISIMIPQAKEQLLVCTIITIIGAFKLYTEVYATTSGGPGNSSQVLGLFLYQQAFLHDDLGMAAVTGVFIFFITVTLSVIQIKLTNSGKE